MSIREIGQIYARRWDIEMLFNLVKTHLKLHVLWSSQPNVVLHQVYSVFIVSLAARPRAALVGIIYAGR